MHNSYNDMLHIFLGIGNQQVGQVRTEEIPNGGCSIPNEIPNLLKNIYFLSKVIPICDPRSNPCNIIVILV